MGTGTASGKFIKGSSAAAKLNFEQVQEIRRHYGEGATQGELARYFGVAIGTVGRIVRGESWVQGAGAGRGSQADVDASQRKVLALLGVSSVEELAAMPSQPVLTHKPPEFPLLSARAASYGAEHVAPPSLLDGGEGGAESSGEGLRKLMEKAGDLPEAVEAALKKESGDDSN